MIQSGSLTERGILKKKLLEDNKEYFEKRAEEIRQKKLILVKENQASGYGL